MFCFCGYLWFLLYTSLLTLCLCLLLIPLTIYYSRKYFSKKRKQLKEIDETLSIAFFHPYCNAGGGGERVLWCAIRAIQNRYPNVNVFVYTGDINASPDEIIKKAHKTFNIILPREIEIIYLHKRHWLDAKNYPYFTMFLQSIGSVILGFEALLAHVPDIYIDSMGFAFTLPLFSYIGGCTTACYVHYPTISTDMLKRVSSKVVGHNNRKIVARSPFLSFAKLVYYRLFAKAYSFCGSFSDTVMVNSTWTEDHITHLWGQSLRIHRVYPPCDTVALKSSPLAPDNISKNGPLKVVSVGQFRPEKDHPLQLQAMYELRRILPEEVWDKITFIFIGSCREGEDYERVKDMQDLCKHLALDNNVQFKINISFEELKAELASSLIGLHAMWNEHFGIGIVECMAAGQIMVAHRSGGPKADIIEEAEGSRNGFLASDEYEYATAIKTIIKMTPQQRHKIREAARSSVDRFSNEEFEKGLLRTLEPLFSQKCKKS